ncbi:hypothetical protein [Nocardia salmonicida]|uniref:hypothetical protein n=1 Tax=Nocardia salmonicida TaxID=53431 RepID=UPI001471C957|nr:hypothetical protein [Nocardia salmonicida]
MHQLMSSSDPVLLYPSIDTVTSAATLRPALWALFDMCDIRSSSGSWFMCKRTFVVDLIAALLGRTRRARDDFVRPS